MEIQPEIQIETNPVKCDFQYVSTINFALQQNNIPIIRRLIISNQGLKNFQQVIVSITTDPEFSYPWSKTLSVLLVDQHIDFSSADLTLIPGSLSNINEALTGTINLSVVSNEGEILYSEHRPIEILAFDEWNGSRTVPEIIAAFISPNHPDVERLLGQAGGILKDWTGSSSFDGYQSRDINKVRLQAAAIYTVIQSQHIGYCVPPASFEEKGQKIRTVDRIIETKLGTCLDLAILCASCLEQVGLNSLIIFIQGHALVGYWLIDETFSESVLDDITLLTKRVVPGVQEISVFEATALTEGKFIPFDKATTMGEEHLTNSDKFLFFVDIKRTRIGKIRPLPLRSHGALLSDEVDINVRTNQIPSRPGSSVDPVKVLIDQPNSTAKTRLELWERKLLDLSLRNPLINFRYTSSSIPILSSDILQLEDSLADGQDFQVHPRPQDWKSNIDNTIENQRSQLNEAEKHLLNEEFNHFRLRADLVERDLSSRLTNLFRSARTNMEETGVNTLYMSLGTLVWFETETSQKPRYAPILLIPMEIVRRSVQTGYVIRRSEDESQLNISLLEMLRQDYQIEIAGLDPLPQDDHGIDVNVVFTTVRRAIMHKPHWDIVETACLGIFSFSKLVMWHDIKVRAEELKRNKIVASLIEGKNQGICTHELPSDEKLDEVYKLKETFCPISADSSQLAAVYAAGEGESLILHGPPGTGKSQTITNIIAQALATGKTVLFVAEKMAALTVVRQRLEKIGLGQFCLELHSNKSKKIEVLNQLRTALEIGKTNSPQDWQIIAEQLEKLRGELNHYVSTLHQQRKIGKSIFQGLAQLALVNQAPDVVKFEVSQVVGATPELLRQWHNLAHQLCVAGSNCGHPSQNVWRGCQRQDYQPQLKSQVAANIERLNKSLLNFLETISDVIALFKIPNANPSLAELKLLETLIDKILVAPSTPPTMIRVLNWSDTQATIEEWVMHGRKRDNLRSEAFSKFSENALQLDLEGLLNKLKEAKMQWLLPRFLGVYQVSKTLKRVKKPGCSLQKEQFELELQRLIELRSEEKALGTAGDRAREFFGRIWNDGNANWDEIIGAYSWAKSIRDIATQLTYSDLSLGESLRNHWALLLSECREQISDSKSKLGQQLNDFKHASKECFEAWNDLLQLIEINESRFDQEKQTPNWCVNVLEQIKVWEEHLNELRDWCTWNRIRQQAVDADLLFLVVPYEKGGLTNEDVEPAFIKGFYQTWLGQEIAKDSILSSFSRGLFEDKINQFRDLDDRYMNLIRHEIFARLGARIPRMNENTISSSEMGILKKELQKQRAHRSLRNLFQNIPNVLNRLKPCLLMSPMSVAQYLDPSHPPFDLVVFDEASQVPTWEAVGAIARGQEAIIVGDPKQLPPTSFFNSSSTDQDEDINIQDLESILDDCLVLDIPQKHLKWHYRSRHESLIAFSNYQYYDNKLLTFPSPDDMRSAVKWRYIQGYYDRGKSKQNRAEAEAVVYEIIQRLSDPELCKQSIGVVTFSKPQQQLIEDLLDEVLCKKPELEVFFNEGVEEPVFVKNLENVQGDERDVILFSVCYGPDLQGRVSMNFGPLNQSGGWRRLNVAISRAKRELIVFSTLRADHIDLSRTNAKGVIDLKAFLEFADRGRKALYEQQSASIDDDYESIFEEQVCKALRDRGYEVHLQVGCSGYRIDLAIVDSDYPGKYILGVECDGANYHRAKTARDRDKLREMVLRGLGWNLHRIWSTDWWENHQREIARIEEAIALSKLESRSSVSKQLVSNNIRNETIDKGIKSVEISKPIADNNLIRIIRKLNYYSPCQLPLVTMPQDMFYYLEVTPLIEEQIKQVMDQEWPISFPLLCRRISISWGMQRAGNRIQDRIKNLCIRLKLQQSKMGGITYYWPIDANIQEYKLYRVPGQDELSKRSPEDLPPEEIANAALEIISEQISFYEEDFIREIAKIFGYQRKGQNVEKYFKEGIDVLIKHGKIRKELDSRLVYVG